MGLETGVTYIEDLVSTNPVGATDNVDEGDDHIRNIKTAVKGSFPNLGAAAVTKTAAEVNDLATKTGTETFTNKTLTSPTITSPAMTGGTSSTLVLTNPRINDIYDHSGAVMIDLTAIPSAVNYFQLFNNSAGANVALKAVGADTNIGIEITPKGTDPVIIPRLTVTTTLTIPVNSITATELAANSVSMASEVIKPATDSSFAVSTANSPFSAFVAGVFNANIGTVSGIVTCQIYCGADGWKTWKTFSSNEAFQFTTDGTNIRFTSDNASATTVRFTQIF